jgi:signal transduction histidine kinase
VASGVGLVLWVIVAVELSPDGTASPVPDAVGALLAVDLLVGVVALALLPLRRLHPVLTATLVAVLTSVSTVAVGAAALAAVSMSTHRRWRGVVVVGLAWAGSSWVNEAVLRPLLPGVGPGEAWEGVVSALLGLVVFATCVATGFYIGARRELLVSLRERVLTAEREQALRADAAREAERTRIAREMHDVLAHRISLVALHAGALAHRDDLTREETVRTATVIRDNAQLALTELRGVLGVLRTGPTGGSAGGRGQGAPDSPGHVEPPQPTLAELGALLADADDAGTRVDLDTAGLPDGDRSALASLSPAVSRSAFRIVQEALTNARKHAAGGPVRLSLAGSPGGRLDIEVRNAVGSGAAWAPPGAGAGLVGLTERAALAGGALEHGMRDDEFVVRAWLPWR